MSTAVEQNGHVEQGTTPATTTPRGKARGRQGSTERKHRKQVSLFEDTQELLWDASERLGMENDPIIKAALRLLLKDCERRGIRRKTNEEMIDEIVGGES